MKLSIELRFEFEDEIVFQLVALFIKPDMQDAACRRERLPEIPLYQTRQPPLPTTAVTLVDVVSADPSLQPARPTNVEWLFFWAEHTIATSLIADVFASLPEEVEWE